VRLLLSVGIALVASPTSAATPCDLDQGFGVKFGANVREYGGHEIRSERAHPRFASYKIKLQSNDPRFNWYSVEADRKSGKIFSVVAYHRIVPDIGPSSDYKDRVVPLAQALMSDLSRDAGISTDFSGAPPYSGVSNGVTFGLWLAFERGGKNASFSISCTNETLEDELQRSILQDEFRGIGG